MKTNWRERRASRDARQANAAIQRIRTEEDYPHREAQLYERKTMVATFGRSTNLPASDYLFEKGTACTLYFATDTNTLYIWNGTAWKSTVLT